MIIDDKLLFNKLKNYSDQLTMDKSEKKYWEDSSISFNTVIGPDGNIYNEKEIFNSTKESDYKRLKQFG